MLERAVAALKEKKEKALEMFNKGEGRFKEGGHLLVAPSRHGQAAREAHLLYEGRWSSLRSRLLQVMRVPPGYFLLTDP